MGMNKEQGKLQGAVVLEEGDDLVFLVDGRQYRMEDVKLDCLEVVVADQGRMRWLRIRGT
jgi:hypothetical protein